jgi:hypothetical protein
MRHFAAPEAGNWVLFDRIQVLSSSQINTWHFAFIFLSLVYYFIHSSPKFSEAR